MKDLRNILDDQEIKKALLEHKNPYIVLNSSRANQYKSDKRFNIHLLSSTTNNHIIKIKYKHNKYLLGYRYDYSTNSFICEDVYTITRDN